MANPLLKQLILLLSIPELSFSMDNITHEGRKLGTNKGDCYEFIYKKDTTIFLLVCGE